MRNRQALLFDHLARGGCLYRYSSESITTVNSLVSRKHHVLDVGCGDGTIAAALDGEFIVGVEISSRCARLTAQKGLKTVIADAVAGLPFAAASFDTIYCIDVLHHLGQAWAGALGECDRLLRQGGVIVIIEPDARNAFVRWTQAPGSPIRVAPFDDEPAIYPDRLLPHLQRRGYCCECRPFQFDACQAVRDVFPMWQRLLKAPVVMTLAWWFRRVPNKFLIMARKSDGAGEAARR